MIQPFIVSAFPPPPPFFLKTRLRAPPLLARCIEYLVFLAVAGFLFAGPTPLDPFISYPCEEDPLSMYLIHPGLLLENSSPAGSRLSVPQDESSPRSSFGFPEYSISKKIKRDLLRHAVDGPPSRLASAL